MSLSIGAIGTQPMMNMSLGGGLSGGSHGSYGGMSSVRRSGAAGADAQGSSAPGAQQSGAQQSGAQQGGAAAKTETADQRAKRLAGGCQTCAQRKYQDGSNDPGVSFQSPTALRPESAATAVMAHEQEHVTRNKAQAAREDRVVLSQSVTLHLSICGECKRPYIAGGTTRTTTAAAKQRYAQVMAGTGAGESAQTGAKFAATV